MQKKVTIQDIREYLIQIGVSRELVEKLVESCITREKLNQAFQGEDGIESAWSGTSPSRYVN